MKLYYGGAEVPSHRLLLRDNNVTSAYLSYVGLCRRVKKLDAWSIAKKFPPDMNVLLDSGAYTVNKGDDLDSDQLAEMAAGYVRFVEANAERVDAFTEFDALALGRDWVEGQRRDFYDDYGDKFMPVWHAEHGLEELERLASRYRRVGILRTSLGDRDIISVLNLLAERRGTLLHGIAMTKPDIMYQVRLDSVGSTSWLSPMKYGETHVWTGRDLAWYPKDYKEQARKRHRTLFTRAGFDAEKIAAGDPGEITRLSLWSWEQLVADINGRRKPKEVMPDGNVAATDAGTPAESNTTPTGQVTPGRQRMLLPGVSLLTTSEGKHYGARADNLRQCNSCFLRERNCPGYKPDADCAYELPVEVRTSKDINALEYALLEMQFQRIAFMRMAEDLEGGYADPNLSSELDRLSRMIKAHRDGTMIKESIIIKSNRPGEAGMIGNIFGKEVADAQALPGPNVADDMIREAMAMDIVEGELVDG